METFSALLALCAGNSSVTGEFPSQRPVARSFYVPFDLCVNKRLGKHRDAGDYHYDVTVMKEPTAHINGCMYVIFAPTSICPQRTLCIFQVKHMLVSSIPCARDVTLDWQPPVDCSIIPTELPPIFLGERMIVFAVFDPDIKVSRWSPNEWF